MNYKRNLGDELFIKNLIEEVKTRDITEDETDKLMELFTEAYGYLPSNLALDPRWLIKKWEALDMEDEDEAIDEWYQKDLIDFVEEQDIELKDKDISFMCEKPQNCNSHKTYGFSCRCIRENFATPTEFTLWAKNELTELKDELKDLLPKEN